jgi:hypothetical protein
MPTTKTTRRWTGALLGGAAVVVVATMALASPAGADPRSDNTSRTGGAEVYVEEMKFTYNTADSFSARLDDIDGESHDVRHSRPIELNSWTWANSQTK